MQESSRPGSRRTPPEVETGPPGKPPYPPPQAGAPCGANEEAAGEYMGPPEPAKDDGYGWKNGHPTEGAGNAAAGACAGA
jgi:hypothetical protein